MKNPMGVIWLLLMVIAAGGCGEKNIMPQATDAPHIGVYDSRAIAVAFVGSDAFKTQMSGVMSEYKKAKDAGDTATMERIDTQMKRRQKQAHMQAFSTAPVDDLLVYIDDQLPKIKQKAGVTLLVSKWDLPAMEKYDTAQTIDLTMELIDAFVPNEKQRKNAIEIQKHKPISLEQAQAIDD